MAQNLVSGATQRTMGSLLRLVPYYYHLVEFFLATVTSDSLIRDLNRNPYLDFCKASL